MVGGLFVFEGQLGRVPVEVGLREAGRDAAEEHRFRERAGVPEMCGRLAGATDDCFGPVGPMVGAGDVSARAVRTALRAIAIASFIKSSGVRSKISMTPITLRIARQILIDSLLLQSVHLEIDLHHHKELKAPYEVDLNQQRYLGLL